MNMSYNYYRNSEGFRDPTAGAAIANVMREQKAKRQAMRSKENNRVRSRKRRRENRRRKRQMEAARLGRRTAYENKGDLE